LANPASPVGRHLNALVGERHPERSPRALARTAQYLAAEFKAQGWKVSKQRLRAWGKVYWNVLAIREPRRRATSADSAPLLIGAHYDTVIGTPGADDNASGLVVLLEVARRLTRSRLTRPIWLAAFSLEEQGYWGSQAFTARLKKAGQPLLGAIILECVGYARQEEGTQQAPLGVPIAVPSRGDFLAVVGNETSRALVTAVTEGARAAAPELVTIGLAVPGVGTALPHVRRSDHVSFWDQDYRAVMLTDTANFRNPHYHQPTDTIETLDLGFLEHVIGTVVETVKRLAVESGHAAQ